jgi:hypothetical protein
MECSVAATQQTLSLILIVDLEINCDNRSFLIFMIPIFALDVMLVRTFFLLPLPLYSQ